MSRPDTISVVAGGWSLKDIDRKSIPGTIIGVNDAAMHLPRCDVTVSMDRLWAEYRWPRLRDKRQLCYLRRSAAQNLDTIGLPWCHIFDNDNAPDAPLSDRVQILNGINSGSCAINLAYIWRPRLMLLFGFDMTRGPDGEKYWYPPYPWKYTTSDSKYVAWAKQYHHVALACAAAGIEVLNVSPKSRIKAFRKVSFEQVMNVPAVDQSA